MATVKVFVPDGKYCGKCMYLLKGTIHCLLFDSFCEEKYPRMLKHDECPKQGSFTYEPLFEAE